MIDQVGRIANVKSKSRTRQQAWIGKNQIGNSECGISNSDVTLLLESWQQLSMAISQVPITVSGLAFYGNILAFYGSAFYAIIWEPPRTFLGHTLSHKDFRKYKLGLFGTPYFSRSYPQSKGFPKYVAFYGILRQKDFQNTWHFTAFYGKCPSP